MAFRGAVITFPGSNCDRDMAVALEKVSGERALRVWHADADLPERLDFIAIPGGFSYGDYLRCGAIASRSPVMRAVIAAAGRGVPVLGVCNGFQSVSDAPTQYLYCFDSEWVPGMAGVAVTPLDPALGIPWPLPVDVDDPAQISAKDLGAPALGA